jgi:hypothetical protein
MLGGDDYKDKIGGGKKPYYRGNQGTPSQGADSTYSSYLARVNRGFEDYEDWMMFPEQEEEELDIYDVDIEVLPLTSKMPRYARTARRARLLAPNVSEKRVTKRYSLLDLPDPQRIDEGTLGWAADVGTDVLGDIGMAVAGAVPVFGDAAAGLAATWNVKQLDDDMSRSASAIQDFLTLPSDETRDKLEGWIGSIGTNLIDLFQRLLEMSPDPGGTETLSGVISVTGALNKLKHIMTVFKRTKAARLAGVEGSYMAPGMTVAQRLRQSLGRSSTGGIAGFRSKLRLGALSEWFMDDLAWLLEKGASWLPGPVGEATEWLLYVPLRIDLLGDLIDDYDHQKEVYASAGLPLEYASRVDVSDIENYQSGAVPVWERPMSQIETLSQQELGEGIMITNKELLQRFIREAIDLESNESNYISTLGGSAVYEPYLMSRAGEESDDGEFLKGFVVKQKMHVGTHGSHPRVTESLFREFIRGRLREKLAEAKKKRRR